MLPYTSISNDRLGATPCSISKKLYWGVLLTHASTTTACNRLPSLVTLCEVADEDEDAECLSCRKIKKQRSRTSLTCPFFFWFFWVVCACLIKSNQIFSACFVHSSHEKTSSLLLRWLSWVSCVFSTWGTWAWQCTCPWVTSLDWFDVRLLRGFPPTIPFEVEPANTHKHSFLKSYSSFLRGLLEIGRTQFVYYVYGYIWKNVCKDWAYCWPVMPRNGDNEEWTFFDFVVSVHCSFSNISRHRHTCGHTTGSNW